MQPTLKLRRELLIKHGWGAKFVRALCKAMGWRYSAQGAPAEWYAAWPEIAKQSGPSNTPEPPE